MSAPLLLLIAAGAGAVVFIAAPRIAEGVRGMFAKGGPSSLDDLRPLQRRFRLLTAVTIALALLLVAVMTATGDRGAANRIGDLGSLTEPGTPADGIRTPGERVPGRSAGRTPAGRTTGSRPAGAQEPAGGNGGSPGAKLTRSDQGVTATSIKFAYFRVDTGFYTRQGLQDPHVERAVNAYVDYVNKHGGILGRRLIADDLVVADPRDEQEIRQRCLEAFGDHKAFMALNSQQFPGLPRCAAQRGRASIDIGYSGLSATAASDLSTLGGRYWIGGMSSDRLTDLWAQFIRKNYGRSTKVGILVHYNETLKRAANQLAAALQRQGMPKPSIFQHTPDNSTAAIQVSNAVAQFQRDGVQLAAAVTNAVVVGIAQRGFTANGYRPEKGWTFSSIAGLDLADTAPLFDPVQMNGAKGVSYATLPSEPMQRTCKQIFEAFNGGATYLQEHGYWCHLIFENAAASRRAGAALTIASWAHGFASLGAYNGNAFGRQTFSATKRDGADQVRGWRFNNGAFSIETGFRDSF